MVDVSFLLSICFSVSVFLPETVLLSRGDEVFSPGSDLEEDPHQEETDLLQQPPPPSSPLPISPENAQDSPQKHLRSLERQLQVLRGGAQPEADPDSLIQFQDADFPLDENLIAAKTKKKKKRVAGRGEHRVFGTPDADEPVSDTRCSGCGALLHCAAIQAPGYLPSEKYKALIQDRLLRGATCQRCHLLTHHQKALNLQLPRDQYRDVVRQIRHLQALVLLVVDLLDLPDSVVSDLPDLVGANKHVVVLGNKIDLLPGDSPGYLRRIRERLGQCCREAGFGGQVTDVHLVSAKTGYGIETLISSLQRSWKYKGDVYLVGTANAGKSTLFNTLLESDYCKSKAFDVIHKATISPWPGEHQAPFSVGRLTSDVIVLQGCPLDLARIWRANRWAGRKTGGQTDRQTDRQPARWKDRQADGQKDRWAGRKTGRPIDRKTGGQIDTQAERRAGGQKDRWAGRKKDRRAGRKTDRRAGAQTGRPVNRWAGKQAGVKTDWQAERQADQYLERQVGG